MKKEDVFIAIHNDTRSMQKTFVLVMFWRMANFWKEGLCSGLIALKK
jgi:hypothetical protein